MKKCNKPCSECAYQNCPERKVSTATVSGIGAMLFDSGIPASRQTSILKELIEKVDPGELKELVDAVEYSGQIDSQSIRKAHDYFKVEENEGE